jgi:hypothetical protein
MSAKHVARVLPGEMSTVQPGPTTPVFMFGTFDPTDGTSSESIRALDEAILGIKEDGDPMAVATHSHSHAEVAADGSSSAFMFGVHPEQPSPAALGELLLHLWATEMD